MCSPSSAAAYLELVRHAVQHLQFERFLGQPACLKPGDSGRDRIRHVVRAQSELHAGLLTRPG